MKVAVQCLPFRLLPALFDHPRFVGIFQRRRVLPSLPLRFHLTQLPSTMFNRLPGAMLKERHMHECKLGRNCGRDLSHDTAPVAESHRLFNPAPPEAGLKAES
jgi:hypothetical protein